MNLFIKKVISAAIGLTVVGYELQRPPYAAGAPVKSETQKPELSVQRAKVQRPNVSFGNDAIIWISLPSPAPSTRQLQKAAKLDSSMGFFEAPNDNPDDRSDANG